jgi:hypothetical protein
LTAVRLRKPQALGRAAICLLLIGLVSLAACSNTNRAVTGSVGVGNGVALLTAGDLTTLYVGQTLQITAAVTNDPGNRGVTWSVQPNNGSAGTLTQITPTSVVLVAPSTVTGQVGATITATANVNSVYASSVTIITNGTPVPNPVQLFPANVNVAYAASFTVSGGVPPFTWALDASSGPLPPGIALLGSTTGLDTISGTPTTANTYPGIVLVATDANSVVARFPAVTLTVNAQNTCVLQGTYALMASGFRGGGGMTHVAHIVINSTGQITGEQDYKDGHRTTLHEQLLSTSNCINRQTNSGQITLNAPSGALLYNVSTTPTDANGVTQSARLQLVGSGDDTASGLLSNVDPSAISAAPPTGSFAFGLLGVEKQEPVGVHFATAGQFTTDSSGTISTGSIDSNNPAAALNAASLTGTLSAPDSSGRGTASLTALGQTSQYVYYIVRANKMLLMNIDLQTATSPRASGFMTPQVGNVSANSFDATALASPSILSLWGAIVGMEPITSQAMGRLSGGNGSTLSALLDLSDQQTTVIADLTQPLTNQPYTVAANGRGTLTLNNGTQNLNLVFYLDGASDGYVVQQNTTDGSGGLLEAQYPMPATGGFPSSLPGYFVGGTQFAMAAGPITLNPLATLAFGSLSSNFTNATFYIDPGSGRGLGTLTQTGVGVQPAALYIVSPTKIDVLRFGTRGVDGNIDWLIQDVQ